MLIRYISFKILIHFIVGSHWHTTILKPIWSSCTHLDFDSSTRSFWESNLSFHSIHISKRRFLNWWFCRDSCKPWRRWHILLTVQWHFRNNIWPLIKLDHFWYQWYRGHVLSIGTWHNTLWHIQNLLRRRKKLHIHSLNCILDSEEIATLLLLVLQIACKAHFIFVIVF